MSSMWEALSDRDYYGYGDFPDPDDAPDDDPPFTEDEISLFATEPEPAQ